MPTRSPSPNHPNEHLDHMIRVKRLPPVAALPFVTPSSTWMGPFPGLPPLAPAQPIHRPSIPPTWPNYQKVPMEHRFSQFPRGDQPQPPKLPHVSSFDRFSSHEPSGIGPQQAVYSVQQPFHGAMETQQRSSLGNGYDPAPRSMNAQAYRDTARSCSSSFLPSSELAAAQRQETALRDMPETPAMMSRYKLTIRQQPIAARACGMGERDRRVVDPPPIVQLSLAGYDPSSMADVDALRTPCNVVHCSLIDHLGRDVTCVPDPHDFEKISRRLMGTIVASPFIGTDRSAPPSGVEHARLGCFFIFPDMSCRQNGLYRLRFTHMQINLDVLPAGSSSDLNIATIESDVFEVFSAKDFPGMRPSTALTKELKRQGAPVSVKKGSEGNAPRNGQNRESSGSEENVSEGSLVLAQMQKID